MSAATKTRAANRSNPGGGKSPAELVRKSNQWRDTYNPLRSLVISRVVAMLEAAERGDYAELQLTLRKVEKRYPVLKALIARRCGAIEKLNWDVKVPEVLPDGVTPEMAEAQRAHLRARYDLIENLTDAFGQLAMAEFRGFTLLQKHRFTEGEHDGAVRELHWLPQFNWVRDGQFGDFYFNADSKFGITAPAALLGETNRLPLRPPTSLAPSDGERAGERGSGLLRSDFIFRECDAPLYEIALIAFVNWCMGRKDWAAFVEIFGLPNAIVILPANIPQGSEDEYRTAAEKVADGVSGALPNGSDAKFPTASVRGNAPFKEFCDAMDADLVLAGTGGLLTMLSLPQGIGGGASGEHGDAFADIAQADARRITSTLQRDFDGPELDEAFPGQPHLAYFELAAEDADDTDKLVANAVALKGAGYEVKGEWLAERTGYELVEGAADHGPQTEDPGVPVSDRAVGEDEFDADTEEQAGKVMNRLCRILNAEGGKWITANGGPVFIEDGETVSQAIARREHKEDHEPGDKTKRGEKFTILPKRSKATIDQVAGLLKERGYKLGKSRFDNKLGTFYKVTDASGKEVEKPAKALIKFLQTESGLLNRTPDAKPQTPADQLRAAFAADLQPARERLARILTISDDALLETKLREFVAEFPELVKDITADPRSARVLEAHLGTGMANGLAQKPLANRRILNGSPDQPRDDQGQFASTGGGSSKPIADNQRGLIKQIHEQVDPEMARNLERDLAATDDEAARERTADMYFGMAQQRARAAEKEKRAAKYKPKSVPIAPGTHENLAKSAIAQAERKLAGGGHTVGALPASASEITKHVYGAMEGHRFTGKDEARMIADAAERHIQNLGSTGSKKSRTFHPEAIRAVDQIRAWRKTAKLDDDGGGE